jgi:hypothetical protein
LAGEYGRRHLSIRNPEANNYENASAFIPRIALCLSSVSVSFCSALAGASVQVVRTTNNGAVPDAEVDQNGTVHVAFIAAQDAFYVQSSDGGKSFSPPLRINSEPASAHPANMFRGPDVALGKSGRVHVIWYGNGYGERVCYEHRPVKL